MIKRIISTVLISTILLALPLWAAEELLTKLYFDSWLPKATAPLEQQISQLRKSFAELEGAAAEIKGILTTEIKIVIGQLSAQIDGQTVQIDVAPAIVNNRTMVPMRFIGEAFGAQFAWDDKTRKVTYTLGELKLELYIDKKTARVNGTQVTLEAAPYIAGGRTMVPLRFVGQYMEASFAWDAVTQTVTINR